MNKEQRVKVQFTETYTYELEIEVYENETILDAIHETDLLINRDANWIESHRDAICVETNFEIKEEGKNYE